jgi:hypothetical protein
MARLTIPLIGTLLFASALMVVNAQQQPLDLIDRDQAPIRYSQPSNDPVAVFLRGPSASKLAADSPSGYLPAVLRALDVPVSSQMLVFSKGSVQRHLIEARNPRALYFNDSVVVGWVRGGFVEIAAQDPQQGTVFYRAVAGPNGLSITRSDDCLSCHHSARTAGVAGLIEPMSHARPLDRRWGGWYVTGNAGSIQHFGNVDVGALTAGAPAPKTPTLPSLAQTFDTRGYLSAYSDVAALMVFEHQMQMLNLLTRLGWETRVAQNEGRLRADGKAIQDIVNQTADYMLFIDEAPIPSRLEGSSGFAEAFSSRGPRDPKGRSLRQLDLTNRLLRYPCSYTIYSTQFEQLPDAAKRALYQRLWTILSGTEPDGRYGRLAVADRRAIVDILRATKSDLPAYFRM